MKIYTKTGDKGETGLPGGKRVSKSALRVQAYGTVDELNSLVGLAISSKPHLGVIVVLTKISNLLFTLGSDLAAPLDTKSAIRVERIGEAEILWLEEMIDKFDSELPELRNFILPGGAIDAAHLHHARTVCRRAERLSVELSENVDIGQYAVKFLNRLSDFLFVAARYSNFVSGVDDVEWNKK